MMLGAIATAAGARRAAGRGPDLGRAFQRRRRAAGDVLRRARAWCRRTRPSRWCSAPISAPRSTRCWKAAPATIRSARRLPIGNLLNRVVGVVVALVALPWIGRWLVALEPDSARAVADFHTAFNLVLAAVFFPLLDPYARAAARAAARPGRTRPIRPGRSISTRPRARRRSSRSAARRARRCAWPTCWRRCCTGCATRSSATTASGIAETKRLDDVLDRLNTAIKAYLTALDPEALTEADHRRVARDPGLRHQPGACRRRGGPQPARPG